MSRKPRLTREGQKIVKELRYKVIPYLVRNEVITLWQSRYLQAGLTVLEWYGWEKYLNRRHAEGMGTGSTAK